MTTQQIFKDIENTGQSFINRFSQLAIRAKKAINSQMNSAKLEAAYALNVSKEQRQKTMSEVKEVKEAMWKEAMEKADGDIKTACDTYEDLCAFP